MLYRILKILVGIGIRFYYKEVKIKNKKLLESDGPRIILANHPNTLMDAWMIGFASKKPIYFMAKATLFNSPLKLRVLRSLNMIPINRKGEGKMNGVSNANSFEACYEILEQGKTVVIFPEGTSYQERHLRELKTGAARIALEAEKRNNGKLQLKIIPIGLNYLQANRFRSDVLIHVGSPIDILPYLSDYQLNSGKAAKRMTEQIRMRMEQILVNSDEKEDEKLVDDLYSILRSKYIKSEEKGVEGKWQELKTIRDAVTEIQVTAPWKIKEINQILNQLKWQTSKFEIRADFLDRRFRSRMFLRQLAVSFIAIVIGLPAFLIGFFHNIMQYKFTDFIVPKLTKDVEYYAPLAVLAGLITYPVVYFGFMFLGKSIFDLNFWQQFFYFWSMPITGFFAYSFYNYLNHISFKWKYVFFAINNKETIVELKTKKEQLKQLLFE
jgi:1-acyl-sn-glycerol-3-phosphate acyltransferase